MLFDSFESVDCRLNCVRNLRRRVLSPCFVPEYRPDPKKSNRRLFFTCVDVDFVLQHFCRKYGVTWESESCFDSNRLDETRLIVVLSNLTVKTIPNATAGEERNS